MLFNKSTNILKAILNLKAAGYPNLQVLYKSGIKVNAVGDALEYYVKDMFANSFQLDHAEAKEDVYREYFTWLGNQNNPPDAILTKSDAIEVKKSINADKAIALNSSPPKDYLYADDPRIVNACRHCEDDIEPWVKKDLLYAVGTTEAERLISLWFVYGNCYAGDREIYSRVVKGLATGISNIQDIEFGETKELARVNKVDPLGITDLRVRGMWNIKSPNKVFSYLLDNKDKKPMFYVLLLKLKYDELRANLSNEEQEGLSASCTIQDVAINNPNNPAQKLPAVFLSGNLQEQSEL